MNVIMSASPKTTFKTTIYWVSFGILFFLFLILTKTKHPAIKDLVKITEWIKALQSL